MDKFIYSFNSFFFSWKSLSLCSAGPGRQGAGRFGRGFVFGTASLLSSRRVVRVSLPAKDEHWRGFSETFLEEENATS